MKTKLLSTLRNVALAFIFAVAGTNWAVAQAPATTFVEALRL